MKRFWDKVDKDGPDGCWEWTAGRSITGYGRFLVDGKNRLAHRVAWELVRGLSQSMMARVFGVSDAAMSLACTRKTWRHVR